MHVESKTSARTPDSVRVIRVVETVALRGRGVEGDVARMVHQYWAFDGSLLAESDPFPSESK